VIAKRKDCKVFANGGLTNRENCFSQFNAHALISLIISLLLKCW